LKENRHPIISGKSLQYQQDMHMNAKDLKTIQRKDRMLTAKTL